MSFSSNFARILESVAGDNSISDWLHQRDAKARRKQTILDVCQQAMHRARYDWQTSGVRVIDIGLLAYRSQENPRINRLTPVATDTRWLRPFVELETRAPLNAQITIRIIDGKGNILFEDQQSGRMTVHTRFLAQNWLPLENVSVARQGRWSVAVYANGELMAIHQFEWVSIGGDEILDQLHTDGEITPELQDAVRNGKFRRMSLDELLESQED